MTVTMETWRTIPELTLPSIPPFIPSLPPFPPFPLLFLPSLPLFFLTLLSHSLPCLLILTDWLTHSLTHSLTSLTHSLLALFLCIYDLLYIKVMYFFVSSYFFIILFPPLSSYHFLLSLHFFIPFISLLFSPSSQWWTNGGQYRLEEREGKGERKIEVRGKDCFKEKGNKC